VRLKEEEITLAKEGDERAIAKLIEVYEFMIKSPAYDAVLTILMTVDGWCEEIRTEKPSILIGKDENVKAVQLVQKLMLDLPQIVADCQKLQATLTGDDVIKLQHDRKIAESGDRAFPSITGSRS